MIAGSGGTAVRFLEETGRSSKVFTFGKMPVDPAMQRWLAQVFANRAGARSSVKRLKTAESMFVVLGMFAAVLSESAAPVRGPQDLTAAHIAAFRLRHAAKKAGWRYLKQLQSILRDDPALPREVLVAMLTVPRPERGGDGAPGGVTAYTDSEMQLIMTAVRHDIRTARDRIRAGRALLARYRADRPGLDSGDQQAGWVLDVFEATGEMPRYPSGLLMAAVNRGGGAFQLASRLCLTLHEVTAFAVLLTALTGENFGTVVAWPAACHRPDGRHDVSAEDGGVALIEQVKPRRGPEREHMVVPLEDLPPGLREVLSGDADDRLFRSPLRLYLLLAELTEVSRRHGGHTSVFSAFTPYPGRHGGPPWVEGVGAHHLRRWASAHGFPTADLAEQAGLPAVSVRRLRQTVIEQARRPVSHTRATMNDHYLMRSRDVRDDSRRVVSAALRDEVAKARAVQRMPVFTAEFLARAGQDLEGAAAESGLEVQTLKRMMAGEQDTVLASCTDHLAGPYSDAGEPCTASFLACLGCQNARALPHQMPVQLAAAERIAQLRGHLEPTLWQVRYEPRLQQLLDILRAYTLAEKTLRVTSSPARSASCWISSSPGNGTCGDRRPAAGPSGASLAARVAGRRHRGLAQQDPAARHRPCGTVPVRRSRLEDRSRSP